MKDKANIPNKSCGSCALARTRRGDTEVCRMCQQGATLRDGYPLWRAEES